MFYALAHSISYNSNKYVRTFSSRVHTAHQTNAICIHLSDDLCARTKLRRTACCAHANHTHTGHCGCSASVRCVSEEYREMRSIKAKVGCLWGGAVDGSRKSSPRTMSALRFIYICRFNVFWLDLDTATASPTCTGHVQWHQRRRRSRCDRSMTR